MASVLAGYRLFTGDDLGKRGPDELGSLSIALGKLGDTLS